MARETTFKDAGPPTNENIFSYDESAVDAGGLKADVSADATADALAGADALESVSHDVLVVSLWRRSFSAVS